MSHVRSRLPGETPPGSVPQTRPPRTLPPASSDAIDRVVDAVLAGRNYRWIARDLLGRLATDALVAARNEADAVKRTKRRLHQIFGAYLWDLRPEMALDDLRDALASGGQAGLRAACRDLLAQHASTRERLPILNDFYDAIFARTGVPRVLMDVACGLGPLALPWMNLPSGPAATTYLAYDIDQRLISVIDGFLTLCGVPHVAALRDAVATPPNDPVDVALLLKSAPCLEQQGRGSTRALLSALDAAHVVLSFPTRSLGGARKGMPAHYGAQLDGLLAGTSWGVEELWFPSELVFVLSRPPSGP